MKFQLVLTTTFPGTSVIAHSDMLEIMGGNIESGLEKFLRISEGLQIGMDSLFLQNG